MRVNKYIYIEVEPKFLYMNHCCDIELQRLYIYDSNTEVFCISMSSPICELYIMNDLFVFQCTLN